ncbi:MAG: M16 family metallopeptidase [Cytophagaceae bacterium]
MEEFDILTLKNGIRVVHKQVTHTKVAHCGFVLDIGSRDEEEGEEGLAHFWEHMVFKGTEKRRSHHIINRLEVVGGELNAYTTKEKVFFYASVLDLHYEKAIELLKDITFDSVFPQKEIEKEKSVVLEEMSMYQDTPEDSILDDFEDMVFAGHSLGVNILGTQESIKQFNKEKLQAFIRKNLSTDRIIFSSIGNIPFAKIKKFAEKYLSDIPAIAPKKKRERFTQYVPACSDVLKPINQSHCMIGNTAYAIEDPRRLPFFMLVNILGGPGMNSKLNMSLREKYGYVYNIESSYTPYTDTGLFYIYFGTEKSQLNKSISLVYKELKYLKEKLLSPVQLQKYKEQLMGQLAMSEESNLNFMQMMGKSLLDLGRIDSLEDIFLRINKVSAIELQGLAQEVLEKDRLSILTYRPEN